MVLIFLWFGVEFAIEMAEDILKEEGELYCLGDIVHNNREVTRLEKMGLEIIDHEKLKVMNPDGSLEELNRPMIVEDLLTHRSGFTYDFLMGCHVAPLYSERDISDNGNKSLEEKCEILSELPLAYQPGSRFNYSVSLDVLARVIEIVNEKDFGDTLKEEIFKPLNMKDTGFGVDEKNLSRLMSTYGASNFKEIMNVGPHKLEETDVSAHNPYDSAVSYTHLTLPTILLV